MRSSVGVALLVLLSFFATSAAGAGVPQKQPAPTTTAGKPAPAKKSTAKQPAAKPKPTKKSPPPLPVSKVTWLTSPLFDSTTPGVTPPARSSLRIRRALRDPGQITLYISVMDGEGEPITGMRATDFQVESEGQPVPLASFCIMADLTSEHLAVVLALGFSDRDSNAVWARDAFSNAFVAELEESKSDVCALLTFRGRISVPRIFSADPLLLKQALSSIHFSGEGLFLNAAVAASRTLIYQNDTTGYGVVILAFDQADSAATPAPVEGREEREFSAGPAVYTLGVDLPDSTRLDSWAGLCKRTGGESFAATGDSLAVRTAVGRMTRVLQGQYVIRVASPLSSRFRVSLSAPGTLLADSIFLAAMTEPEPDESDMEHSRLVRLSLWVGAAFFILILALRLRHRT